MGWENQPLQRADACRGAICGLGQLGFWGCGQPVGLWWSLQNSGSWSSLQAAEICGSWLAIPSRGMSATSSAVHCKLHSSGGDPAVMRKLELFQVVSRVIGQGSVVCSMIGSRTAYCCAATDLGGGLYLSGEHVLAGRCSSMECMHACMYVWQ